MSSNNGDAISIQEGDEAIGRPTTVDGDSDSDASHQGTFGTAVQQDDQPVRVTRLTRLCIAPVSKDFPPFCFLST